MEQWVNNRLDNQDLLLQGIIDATNANAGTIKETLELETGKVGTTLSTNMASIWNSTGEDMPVVAKYTNDCLIQLTGVGTILGQILSALPDAGAEKNDGENSGNESPKSPSSNLPNQQESPSNETPSSEQTDNKNSDNKWGSWFIKKKDSYPKHKLDKETSIEDRLKYFDFDSSFTARAQYYKAMGGTDVYKGTAKQNRWMISEMKANSFSQGGTIGGLIRRTGEDGFVLARAGETIFTPDQIKQLKESIFSAQALVQGVNTVLPKTPTNNQSVNITGNTFEVNFELPGVTNSEQLIGELQSSRRFEKIIQQQVLGAMLGKNSLEKFKFK